MINSDQATYGGVDRGVNAARTISNTQNTNQKHEKREARSKTMDNFRQMPLATLSQQRYVQRCQARLVMVTQITR